MHLDIRRSHPRLAVVCLFGFLGEEFVSRTFFKELAQLGGMEASYLLAAWAINQSACSHSPCLGLETAQEARAENRHRL